MADYFALVVDGRLRPDIKYAKTEGATVMCFWPIRRRWWQLWKPANRIYGYERRRYVWRSSKFRRLI